MKSPGVMLAYCCARYGPPETLQLREVPVPVPRPGELRVKVRATTVTSADSRIRSMRIPSGLGLFARLALGVDGPRQPILGMEFAGVVDAIGAKVTAFKEGDAVFGLSGAGMGCHAEYVCLPARAAIARKPAQLDFEAATALPFGGLAALDFLRRASLMPGDQLLVNGASGAVGSALVQLAQHFGAHVTGVCSSSNAGLVQSLGAHRVIDYRSQDPCQEVGRYDLIVDAVGNASFSRCKHALKHGGRLVLAAPTLRDMVSAIWINLFSDKRVISGPAAERADDMVTLAHLAQAGSIRPVIEQRLGFDDLPEAHRHVDSGRKKGSVVIAMHAP